MKIKNDTTNKPYHRCFSCPRFRNTCGGKPTRGMDLNEWCEYMRDVKELAHLTNAFIANESEVSIKTIERIMAINIEQDIMRSTARRIERVIIGQVGEYNCYVDYDGTNERINRLLLEVEHLKKECERYAKIIDKYIE